ncbi:MAG: ABC transporter ATP-binding protein [Chloroflexi bacterium]|nr:MAG: ABC transporter-like protein [Chloroflexi bacterium OLB13]MBC6957048.1 ABC transporter ATP-binding protein [Chloroflexota bacterium]MBV6437670.1 putative ABC transporter ATP-binding protein [Anaerolineae bacterium]MDL1917090.1 ABC transporter ATP-binding protein [Anaerolineae bacterium CFX4]OQY78100.1 MAG: ABC transporter [Anaerolineae bacterium UTCFX5]
MVAAAAEFVTHRPYQSDHRSPARFIWSHVRRQPILIITMLIGAFSNGALASAIPYFTGQAFNAMLADQTQAVMQTIGSIALALFASQLIRSFLQLMRNGSSETFSQRLERDVRDELYASLLGKSMSFHDSQAVGEIMARVTNDVREVNFFMNPGMNLLVGSSMFLIMPILFSPGIHPALILTPLTFVILHVIVQYIFVRRLHPIAQQVRHNFGRMNARLAEALDGLQIIKGSAQEEQESERFDGLVDEVKGAFIRQGGIEAQYFSNLLLPLSIAAGLVHSAMLYQQGLIDIGGIVTYNGLLSLFGFPVFTSLNSLSRLALGLASAQRILAIINTETDLDRNEAGYNAPIHGDVVFEHVDFGYASDNLVLHDISFTARAGQTVAIVGQTGAGKSTVTKLINRIYDTRRGRVTVDGVDVREWNLKALRAQISIIEQDIFLYSRTIADNIAFGKPDASREEIIEAAKQAQAHEFISGFENGYETVIGQRGVTLSGGQRQRLAIARAFLTNPPILILDDSTSAIDSATEDKIQRAIYAAAKGRTTLLITHRLSQIRWADHIVVLRNGRVAAQGTHEQLLAGSDDYRRIFARYEGDAQSPSVSVQTSAD